MTTEPLNAFSAMDIHSRVSESVQEPMTNETRLERIVFAQSMLIYKLSQEYGIDNADSISVISDTFNQDWNKLSLQEQAISTFLHSPEGGKATVDVARLLIEEERNQLASAQTVFVTEQIVDEVIEAAKTMPDNILIPQDIFIPNGILIFEKPLEYALKVQGMRFCELWSIKCVQFNTANGGINVRMYGNWISTTSIESNEKIYYSANTNSFEFENVADPDLLREKMFGKNVGVVSKDLLSRTSTTMNGEMLARKATGNKSLVDSTFFSFNSDKEIPEELETIKRQLIALFRLTYSYLDVENHKPPRQFVKRAKRSNRQIPEDYYVSVLTLRHKNYEGSSGIKHASPKFAFRVRGHWAKRYLRSTGLPVGDPKAYRFVYISDYIKGKDKTLVESRRVIGIKN